MDEPSALLARLTRAVAVTTPGAPLTLRLCLALVDVLGRDGGSLSIGFDQPSRTVLSATDDYAERLEDLQDVLGEGPSLDAYRFERAVTATPAEMSARWPLLAPVVTEQLGSAHVVALPMVPVGTVLGVITIHGRRPLPAADLVDEAQYLANAIGVAVLGGIDGALTDDELWSSRDRVDQAVGMVVAQLRIPPADALAVLRAHAFAQDARVSDIAAQVLSGALDFLTGRGSASERRGDAP